MANNVTFKVSFEQISKAAKERLKEMFSRFQDDDCNFGDMFVDGKEGSPTYEETNTRNWYNENIGSKWCYLEEYDDDYLFGRSAWAPPSEGFHWLAEQLGELDPELLMNVSFEDEMPNFVGWAVFGGSDLWDEGIEDDDAIREIVSKYSPGTNLDDEDEYHEALWETIYDWQRENFNQAEKEIINSREIQVD